MFMLIFLALLLGSVVSVGRIVYSAEGKDRISGLYQSDSGRIFGSIGVSDRVDVGAESAMVISKDNGETWSEIWIPFATDRKTYMITGRGKTILAARGDRGAPQILISEDDGDSWGISLDAAAIQKLGGGGSVYSIVYRKAEDRFYAFSNNLCIISDNGKNWTKYKAWSFKGVVRNAYYSDEAQEMYVPVHDGSDRGLYIFRKGQQKPDKVLPGLNLAGFRRLENGVMLATEYQATVGINYYATSMSRQNGVLTVKTTAGNPQLPVGAIVSISVSTKSPFSCYNNMNLPVKSSHGDSFTVMQPGEIDVPETKFTGRAGVIYVGTGINKLYRSENGGKTWELVYTHQGNCAQGYVMFSRDFIDAGNGVVYSTMSGYEEEYNYAGMGVIFKSTDYGRTWTLSNDLKGLNGRRLNAFYVSIRLKDGRVFVGCQFDRLIMELTR